MSRKKLTLRRQGGMELTTRAVARSLRPAMETSRARRVLCQLHERGLVYRTHSCGCLTDDLRLVFWGAERILT